MTPLFKGFVWIAFLVALWGLACKAKAGTLAELQYHLEDIQKVYPKGDEPGHCWFNKDGFLTFKQEERTRRESCQVGFKNMDSTVHYVLTFRFGGRPETLTSYDEKTKKKEIVWRFGPVT